MELSITQQCIVRFCRNLVRICASWVTGAGFVMTAENNWQDGRLQVAMHH